MGVRAMFGDLVDYYRTLFYYWLTNGSYAACPYFRNRIQARVQLYSYALTLGHLWSKPHYRARSLADDMRINFRNVAVPGTGVPLSLYVCCRPVAVGFMLIAHPIISLLSAFHLSRSRPAGKSKFAAICEAFSEQLVAPQHWFGYWRLNSFLAAYHQFETKAPGYRQEDKWTFLVEGEKVGVPISPYLKMDGIVCKDKNEEGGMGLHFFQNATAGGKWIIQERLRNSDFLRSLLPDNAPLSTFRVMTASRGGLTPGDPRLGRAATLEGFQSLPEGHVRAISCVFRAGRLGANTDHNSILFDVDKETGRINVGTRNMHWYRLGLAQALTCPWSSSERYADHPDGGRNGSPVIHVQGKMVPDIQQLLDVTCQSHFLLLPDVPLVGWDVCLTDKGTCMLEVNLSCNFFKGSFDAEKYFQFIADYFVCLDQLRLKKQQ